MIGRAAVLLAANGIIKTAKQLPEESRTAVCRVALCLAGASAGVRCNGLIGGGAVLLVVNGIIRTAK